MKLIVCYNFPGGSGRSEFTRQKDIVDFEDIIEIEKAIAEKNNFDKIAITNIIPLPIKEIEANNALEGLTKDDVDYLKQFLKVMEVNGVQGLVSSCENKQFAMYPFTELIKKIVEFKEKSI